MQAGESTLIISIRKCVVTKSIISIVVRSVKRTIGQSIDATAIISLGNFFGSRDLHLAFVHSDLQQPLHGLMADSSPSGGPFQLMMYSI